jgi:tripartite-type tricarboxylate transporter receptor subunit TctC
MRAVVGALFATLFFATAAFAQAYPAKPVRIVVGYPPGGSGDFVTRLIADELAKNLGVAVVAENRAGAGGNLAADTVARAPADGYTVLSAWHHSINIALYKTVTYDHKDFIPVTKVASGPSVICVNAAVPAKSLKELIDYARANPEKLFVASAGFGSAPHLAYALFEAAAGVKFTAVQYKGGGPAAQSLLAGDTNVMFGTAPTMMGFVRAGRVRALAVSTRAASPAIPGIPGAEEAGLPGYESTFWFGLYVPAGTPPAAVRRLHEAAVKGLVKPEVREKLALQGMDPTPSASPQAFEAEIKQEAPVLEKLIRDSGARVE